MTADVERNLRLGGMRLGLLAMGLQDFSAHLLARARQGKALDANTVADIKAACILNLKNSQAFGLAIHDEADVFTKAIAEFDEFVDGAIESSKYIYE